MLHDVKITCDPGRPTSSALLTIDGEEFKTATALKFEAKPDHFALVTLDFISQSFTHEGPAVVAVSDETAELLVKLGWTPPIDQ